MEEAEEADLDDLICGSFPWFKSWVRASGYCTPLALGKWSLPDYNAHQERALLVPVEVCSLQLFFLSSYLLSAFAECTSSKLILQLTLEFRTTFSYF